MNGGAVLIRQRARRNSVPKRLQRTDLNAYASLLDDQCPPSVSGQPGRALLYLARAVGRKLRVHGGCARSTKHPSTEARHEEENHQGNRRDSEVTVCAVRTFRPSYPSLRLHSYSSVLRQRIARRVQAKTLIHAFRLSANVGLELKFQEHERATTVRLPTNGADVWVAPMSGCVSQANE
jgi:hypothetical protein